MEYDVAGEYDAVVRYVDVASPGVCAGPTSTRCTAMSPREIVRDPANDSLGSTRVQAVKSKVSACPRAHAPAAVSGSTRSGSESGSGVERISLTAASVAMIRPASKTPLPVQWSRS